jgi:hypothetical protein
MNEIGNIETIKAIVANTKQAKKTNNRDVFLSEYRKYSSLYGEESANMQFADLYSRMKNAVNSNPYIRIIDLQNDLNRDDFHLDIRSISVMLNFEYKYNKSGKLWVFNDHASLLYITKNLNGLSIQGTEAEKKRLFTFLDELFEEKGRLKTKSIENELISRFPGIYFAKNSFGQLMRYIGCVYSQGLRCWSKGPTRKRKLDTISENVLATEELDLQENNNKYDISTEQAFVRKSAFQIVTPRTTFNPIVVFSSASYNGLLAESASSSKIQGDLGAQGLTAFDIYDAHGKKFSVEHHDTNGTYEMNLEQMQRFVCHAPEVSAGINF